MKATTSIVIILALGIVFLIGTSIVDREVSTDGLIWFGLCAVIALGIFIYKLMTGKK